MGGIDASPYIPASLPKRKREILTFTGSYHLPEAVHLEAMIHICGILSRAETLNACHQTANPGR